MSKKVLIVYGTRYGSTEEISNSFKQNLEKNGFIVDLFNLNSKNIGKLELKNYSGILIGSGIQIGKWTKQAYDFLKKHINEINNKKISTGIFLSSGEGSDPKKHQHAIEEYLVKIFNEFGLIMGDHILYDAFGGVYDLSSTSKMGWFMKKMLGMAAKEDPIIVLNERKDYRDWDQINKFLQSFISKIQ